MVNITPTQQKILITLAEGEPKTYYDLWKHEKVASSNKTVLDALKNLLARKLITVKRKGEASGPGVGGRKKKFYGLTDLGLLQVFTLEESWKHIKQIAHKQADKIPLIFGKWGFFERKGVGDKVIERLKEKVLMVRTRQEKEILDHRDLFQRRHKDKGKANLEIKAYAEFFREIDEALIASDSRLQKLLKRDITNAVLGLRRPFLRGKELTEFMSIFKEDDELREYIRNEIARIENNYVQYLRNIRSWKSWWEQP